MQQSDRARTVMLLTALGTLGGSVLMQPSVGRTQQSPCPTGMSYVAEGGYCIDRFEASLVEVRADGSEEGWSPYLNPGRAEVRAQSRRGVAPQGYISQRQAASACARAGKRLCTDGEWFRACRGPARRTHGYSNTREGGRCNENHRWHPVVRLFSATTRYLWGMVTMNDPQINQLPGTLSATGAHPGCTNENGVYDMVGNLHEWTADPTGTFRGGYYMDTSINGEGCWYTTRGHDTEYHDYSIGFRCCASAGQ